MLTFLKVHSPTDIADLLKKFDPKTDTWIISDLKSKQEVQKHSIQLQGYFIDDAVLRISDFWRLWMRRLCPTINLVTSDFIEVLVKNFVDEKGDTFQLLPSESSTLVKALQEFAPILLHPQSDELLQEWLSEQNEEKDWVRWYQLARFCVDYLVIEKKIIDSKWAAAYLQTLDLNFLSWQRKIYLDLGSELSSIEMGLIKHISQKQDVVIIVPNPSWAVNFPYLLKTYTENLGYGKTEDHSSLASVKELQSNQFIKLSTELAEIKWTTAQVRQWLDKKVPFSDIAVIAADVEKYWPVLNIYLNAEGIPCQKNSVAKLNSLGIVQTFWLN